MEKFADEIAREAQAAGESFAENPVRFVRVYYGSGGNRDEGSRAGNGDEKAAIQVELSPLDEREVTTREYLAELQSRINRPPGIEQLSLREQTAGPPGADLDIELSGPDIHALKAASLELQDALRGVAGLSLIRDDTPYGKEQIVYELTPLGRALGLDVAAISAQLRDAFDGRLAQTFYDGPDEVEVRVLLADRENFDRLGGFQIQLPDGNFAALADVVTLRTRRGFDTILHASGRPAIKVTGEVAPDLDPNALIAELRRDTMPALAGRYGVDYSFEGKSADERETIADMQLGLVLALIFIYIILTWVFSSWSIPFVIMVTMPLGIIGTVLGHWIMGYAMSILSFFGVFTLFGIIVHDSIVLVRFYQELRAAEPDADADALIVKAACLRLRAVLVTSLTTIGGLTPLMFEKSQQAQFLIPMAISICFGLAFATFLILLFTPACLSFHQAAARVLGRFARRLVPEAA
jgi:multidrug efflux pump subunit AcrB